MGQLIGIKFLPREGPFGWGNFSPDYLESLKTYARAKQVLMSLHDYEASSGPTFNPIKSLKPNEAQAEQAAGMNDFFIELVRGKN